MKREAKELNNLIEQVSQKVVDKVVNEKYLVSRMAVIVNEFDPNTNSASIIIPTDLSNHTDYKYPNRTGMTSLRSTVWENGQIKTYGDKVYLVYQSNNISQGWLESNKSLDIVKEVSRDYLTKADAAATYETKTHAATTYETKTDASNTYVKKSGDTMTGDLTVPNVIVTNGVKIPNAGGNVGILDVNGNPILRKYASGATELDAINNAILYLGYQTTSSINLLNGKTTVDGNGNFRAEGYGSFGGHVYADGGQVIAGTSTLSSRDTYVICRSIAGDIYFSCGNTATAVKGIWAKNNAGTYSKILTIDQSNNVVFGTGFSVNGGVYLSGNLTADGGDIHAGNTSKQRTANNGVHSVAGKIYLHTEGTTSGKRGLWVSNRSDTYKEIISVDQNNVATFNGHTTRSAIWAKGSGSHSIAVSATGIPAKVQVKQIGSDFTISNGNVICGRAGTVRVTCKLFVWSNVVNGGGMTAWIRISGTNNTDTQTTMSPFTNGVMYLEGIFTVSANTAINYQIRNDSGSATLSHQATSSMIVEYLD